MPKKSNVKKSTKAFERNLNYTTLSIGGVVACLMATAIALPFWFYAPNNSWTSFTSRNYGLIKVSGAYTNTAIDFADLSWMQVRDAVCNAYQSRASGLGSAKASVTNIATSIAGGKCPSDCVGQMSTRCNYYRGITYVNFLIIFLLLAGPLLVLTAGLLPVLSKEKKADKYTNMYIAIGGVATTILGLAVFILFYLFMFRAFNANGYYPTPGYSISFWLCVSGVIIILAGLYGPVKKVKMLEEKEAEKAKEDLGLIGDDISGDMMGLGGPEEALLA